MLGCKDISADFLKLLYDAIGMWLNKLERWIQVKCGWWPMVSFLSSILQRIFLFKFLKIYELLFLINSLWWYQKGGYYIPFKFNCFPQFFFCFLIGTNSVMVRHFVGMTKSRVGRHLIMCCIPYGMKDWPS